MLEAREERALSDRKGKARWVSRGLWVVGILILLVLFGPSSNRRMLVDAIRELNAPPAEEEAPTAAPDLLKALKEKDGIDSGDVEFAHQFMDFLGSGTTPDERRADEAEMAGKPAGE